MITILWSSRHDCNYKTFGLWLLSWLLCHGRCRTKSWKSWQQNLQIITSTVTSSSHDCYQPQVLMPQVLIASSVGRRRHDCYECLCHCLEAQFILAGSCAFTSAWLSVTFPCVWFHRQAGCSAWPGPPCGWGCWSAVAAAAALDHCPMTPPLSSDLPSAPIPSSVSDCM